MTQSLRHRYVIRKMTGITVEQDVITYRGIWRHDNDSYEYYVINFNYVIVTLCENAVQTSWLNWFFTRNQPQQVFFVMKWLILYDSYTMSHHIYDVMITQWFWYDVIITLSFRNTQNDSYHYITICNDRWRHMRHMT